MLRMKDMISEFIYDCEMRKLTKKTIKGYRNHLLYFNKFLAGEDITDFDDVSVLVIKKYITMHNKKGSKATYVNSAIKVLKAFYKWAIYDDYINEADNPMKKIGYQKEGKTLIKTFNDDEVSRMMNVYKGYQYMQIRNKAIMAMLLDTGIRNYELCCLDAAAVKQDYILVWGKGNKERVVPKSAYLSKTLIRYEKARESYFELRTCDSKYYFLSRTGRQLTVEAIERVVRKAGEEANIRNGIRCSPHTCRHFFAQSQLMNGNDLYSISRLLGHSSVVITKRYLQSMEDEDVLEKGIEYSPLMNLNRRKCNA